MDREVVLAVLAALGCGGALCVAGWCPAIDLTIESGRVLERRAWRRLWLPFGPAVFLLAALCGWAVVEPASAERVPNCLLWAALPFAVILTRALWRGARGLRRAEREVDVGAVGLWRPRIVISERVAAALDASALAAALAHERVHVRHGDPLRIWLASFGTDLLWPWPAARRRLGCWSRALELARDEEARRGETGVGEARHGGVAGPDLAAAILGCLRMSGGARVAGAATLCGDAAFLQERITRLLEPIDGEAPMPSVCVPCLIAAAGLLLAGVGGIAFGEPVVRALFALV